MKLYSYAKKIIHILSTKFLYRDNFIKPNLYLFNIKQTDIPRVKCIFFELDSDEYMHLGDHLFFLPLIKSFIDSGYEVDVRTTKAMHDLFKMLNLNVVEAPKPLEAYDLIISRFELIQRLKNYKSLLLDVSKNLTQPICDQMLAEFGKYFKLKAYIKPDFMIFYNKDILKKFNLPTDKKLVFFNLYCDASSYLITQAKKNQLINFVKEYANNPNYAVVFVGGKSDKEKDKNLYDFNFIDLRGKTTVIDIFALVGASSVEYYIGFDAFIMHVFSLLNKRSFVVFRGRLTKQQDNMLRKYHVNLFNEDHTVTLLN